MNWQDYDSKYGRKLSAYEPDWITWDIKDYPFDKECYHTAKYNVENGLPIQQDDLLKPLYMDIVNYGLNYAFKKWQSGGQVHDPQSQTSNKKHVIIVGAGMAGLVAAYELSQVGHGVTILEQDKRYGGRVLTLREESGLAKGLFGEAGAMRLPCPVDEEKTHFLTALYTNNFKLGIKPFVNACDNGFLKFYDEPAIKVNEWDDSKFDELWKGWDSTLKKNGISDITDIDGYYSATVRPVKEHLYYLLKNEANEFEAWNKWIEIWSQFSLDNFLQSSFKAVKANISDDRFWEGFGNEISILEKYLPWPDAALTAYSTYSYTEQLDQSIVQYLRDDLGQWWSPKMHRIDNGTDLLPEAFTKPNKNGWNQNVHLYEKIHFNQRVNEIKYKFDKDDPNNNHVTVVGYHTTSKRPFTPVKGDAVIVTTPINAIRQIAFKSMSDNLNPPIEFYKAVEDIFTGPSTKIFLQSKTRFWESEKYNIKGGFSKTNLPIGQIHYPSNEDDSLPEGGKGVLLIYTWKSEAILFGALDPAIAVREAVEQVATIHPEIENEFETGVVHAWNNQPSAQGAYALLKPRQYQNVSWLRKPMFNVHFAGEGISSGAGWIQGALESGLRAAYQFYVHNEEAGPALS